MPAAVKTVFVSPRTRPAVPNVIRKPPATEPLPHPPAPIHADLVQVYGNPITTLLRALDDVWNTRPCFICTQSSPSWQITFGRCKHRELEVGRAYMHSGSLGLE